MTQYLFPQRSTSNKACFDTPSTFIGKYISIIVMSLFRKSILSILVQFLSHLKKIIIFVGSFNELRFSIFYNTVWDFGTKVERAQFPLIRRDKDLTIHFNRYLNFISEVLRDL
ncbi:hypothetical protein F4703DRAFT_1793877 [Phycomyces blakesleeanus]